MYRIRVKYRGRDVAVHTTDDEDEAHDLVRVYLLLDYPEDRIILETLAAEQLPAA